MVGYGEGSEESLRVASGGTLSIAYHHGSWRKSPRILYMAGLNISVKFIVQLPFHSVHNIYGGPKVAAKLKSRGTAKVSTCIIGRLLLPPRGHSLGNPCVRSATCNASFSLRDKRWRAHTRKNTTLPWPPSMSHGSFAFTPVDGRYLTPSRSGLAYSFMYSTRPCSLKSYTYASCNGSYIRSLQRVLHINYDPHAQTTPG